MPNHARVAPSPSTVYSIVSRLPPLISHGIRSFAHSLFALLLKMAQIKERPWVNHSGCSEQKSELSDSLRSLITKEWPWANRSDRSEHKSNLSDFLTKNERFARKTDERIPNPAHLPPLPSRLQWVQSPLNTEGDEVRDKSIYRLSYYCLLKNFRMLCRFVQVFLWRGEIKAHTSRTGGSSCLVSLLPTAHCYPQCFGSGSRWIRFFADPVPNLKNADPDSGSVH